MKTRARLRPATLALLLATSVAHATTPSTDRLEALLAAHQGDARELVRALLEDPEQPAETSAWVYVKPEGQPGVVTPLDETEMRLHPWQSPPSWYVAFRYGDRRLGSPLPPTPRGDIEMSAPDRGEIAIGAYQNAGQFAFEEPGQPGLSVKGACAGHGGSFEILEMDRGRYALMERFGATFERDGCRGFMVYRRGTNDYTGYLEGSMGSPGVQDGPLPTLDQVIAGFAAEDPRLVGFEVPDTPAEDTIVAYGTGYDWVAQGEKQLVVARGAEVRVNENWAPERRVIDLEVRKPKPDGFMDFWELKFASPHQMEMRTGIHEWAGNFPFHAMGFPGIRVAIRGRGCGTTSGMFRVLELKRDADLALTRFAVAYEQHCETWGPVLTGFVAFRKGSGPARRGAVSPERATLIPAGRGAGVSRGDPETSPPTR